MLACLRGNIDTARMLVDEFNASIDIQDNVSQIARLWLCCASMCLWLWVWYIITCYCFW